MMIAIMMVALGAFAQTDESKEGIGQRFLSDEVCLQCALSLPEPPSETSEKFAKDIKEYKLGKEEREKKNIREEVLREDETSIFALFSSVLGLKVSKENTPEIYKLAKTAINDASFAAAKGKEHFKRTKPYVYFHDESLASKDGGVKDKENSYPSEYSTKGWILALILGVIAQEHSEALIKCAEQYAAYRVKMGRNWKSDIDAGRTLAITIFSKEVVNPEYKQQLLKAKAEYKSKR